jgi:hypothetical protein
MGLRLAGYCPLSGPNGENYLGSLRHWKLRARPKPTTAMDQRRIKRKTKSPIHLPDFLRTCLADNSVISH